MIPGISEKVDLNYKIGNWTYTVQIQFSKETVVVKPKATTIKRLKKSGKKAVKITYKKVSGVSGYQIYMSTKKKSGYAWNFTILHIKTGEKDHQTPEKRDDQDGMCINLQKN